MSACAEERSTERVALADLGRLARGTAYVESLTVLDGESSVRLAYPFGRYVEAVVPVVPKPPTPPSGLRHVFSVRVRHGDAGARCSALGSSGDGPLRVDVEIATALGLAAGGVRTVFTTD